MGREREIDGPSLSKERSYSTLRFLDHHQRQRQLNEVREVGLVVGFMM